MGGWDEEQPVSALSAHPPLPTPGPEGVPAPRGQLRAEAHRGQTYTWPSAQGRGHTESITSVRALAWDFILNFLALGLVAFGCVWVSSAVQSQKQHLAQSSHLPPVQFLG